MKTVPLSYSAMLVSVGKPGGVCIGHPGERSGSNVLDNATLALLAMLIALPFGEVFILKLGFAIINGFDIFYLAIIALLLLRAATLRRLRHAGPLVLFTVTVIVYTGEALVAPSSQKAAIISQLREFLPFLLAGLFLVVGTKATTERFMRYVVWSSIASSVSAIIIHYFVPDLLLTNSPLGDVAGLAEYGRLYWKNGCVLLLLTLFLISGRRQSEDSEDTVLRGVLPAAFVLAVVAEVLSMGRSGIIGVSALLIGSWMQTFRVRSLLRAAAVGALITGVVVVASRMDERVDRLVQQRFLGGDSGISGVYQEAVEEERTPIYVQYAADLRETLPLGMGLGRPYATYWWRRGTVAYITDISVLSFVLPFGVFGLAVFAVFVRKLYQLLNESASRTRIREVKAIKLLLFISLILSLNVDLYSRDNFVVLLTVLILTLPNNVGGSYVRYASERGRQGAP